MKSILIIGMIAILGFYFYKGDQTAPKAKQDFKTMIKADPGVYIVQQEEEAERQWII